MKSGLGVCSPSPCQAKRLALHFPLAKDGPWYPELRSIGKTPEIESAVHDAEKVGKSYLREYRICHSSHGDVTLRVKSLLLQAAKAP